MRGPLGFLLLALPSLAGCVTYVPLRVSSEQFMKPHEAEAEFKLPAKDVEAALSELFAARGIRIVNHAEANPKVTWYVYKGARQTVSDTKGYADRYSAEVHTETYNIGSWFGARIESTANGSTLLLLGKPTLNGTEVCSDADRHLVEAQYWCTDTKFQPGAPELSLVQGTEEADTVRGVLLELKKKLDTDK